LRLHAACAGRIALVLAVIVLDLAEQAVSTRAFCVLEEAQPAQLAGFVLLDVHAGSMCRTRVLVSLPVATADRVDFVGTYFRLRSAAALRVDFLATGVIPNFAVQSFGAETLVVEEALLAFVSRQIAGLVLGNVCTRGVCKTLVVVGTSVTSTDRINVRGAGILFDPTTASSRIVLFAARIIINFAVKIIRTLLCIAVKKTLVTILESATVVAVALF
jgi:hypothetical protein